MPAKNFVHLHLHTDYSLLDGACAIPKVMDRAVELLGESADWIKGSAAHYVELSRRYMSEQIGEQRFHD